MVIHPANRIEMMIDDNNDLKPPGRLHVQQYEYSTSICPRGGGQPPQREKQVNINDAAYKQLEGARERCDRRTNILKDESAVVEEQVIQIRRERWAEWGWKPSSCSGCIGSSSESSTYRTAFQPAERQSHQYTNDRSGACTQCK